jgi:hypothetical protein
MSIRSTSFQTKDFPLSSSLSSKGFPLIGLDRTDLRRVQFCFKRTKELEDAIESFWRGELLVEPRAFAMHQKLLKSRIYSEE